MGLAIAEGRRRGLNFFFFFFFLPRELAFGGISVASIDIASSRHVSAPCEHGLVPVAGAPEGVLHWYGKTQAGVRGPSPGKILKYTVAQPPKF